MARKIFTGLCIVFLLIQFFRPSKNINSAIQQNDISNFTMIPQPVETILVKACYDCHSNNSTYPWYYNIQPVGWWMAHHINEGKEELNFSEFAAYPLKRQIHKLHEIADEVHEGKMPISSYTWTHGNARLSKDEISVLSSWAESLAVQLEQK